MLHTILWPFAQIWSAINFISLIIACFAGLFIFIKLRKNSSYSMVSIGIQTVFATLVIYTLLQMVSPGAKNEISNKTEQSLIIGTSADFPPFAFMRKGDIVGFDIDIIKNVAKKLSKKLVIKNMPYSALIPQIQLGKVQIIAAGMTPTPARAKRVLFSKPYFTDDLIIISKADHPITSLADLNDKEVVVNDGYTAENYMSKIEGPILRRLKSPAEAFLAIKNGRTYAFATARATVKPFFDKNGSNTFSIFSIPDTKEPIALAISMKFSKLQAPVERALSEMKKDGTIETLKKKWKMA